MITAIILILIFTSIIWILNKKLPRQICPICAGVTLTWLTLFLGMFFGKLPVLYQVPTAILAGGTVVGLMYQLEKFIKPQFLLFWKTLFVISGFWTVYSLIDNQWVMLIISLIVNIAITFLLKIKNLAPNNQESEQIKKQKDKMKNCC